MAASFKSDKILQRMMFLHPKIIDLTLDRVWQLLDKLGNPERKLPPVIHLAGTNGKGSTQAMILAGLEAEGHKVQAYTSPHLARFHERIRLSDGIIAETHLQAVLEECETANGTTSITYFEITTVAAILAFSRDPADFCLLETGLGGRLDATNICAKPRLTVITPISIDHQQYLGETLAEIAGEKAGILKSGVPCIVGAQTETPLDVIETHAEKLGSELIVHNRDWQVWEEHGRMAFQDENGLLDLSLPNLLGAHQVSNAGTAIAALRELGMGETAASAAISNANWPARMQRLVRGPLVDAAGAAEIWLDGGHNPAAGAALAESLTRLPDRPLYAICGMLNTKDVAGYMRPMAHCITKLYGVDIPETEATLPGIDTTKAAISVGIEAVSADSVASAVNAIVAHDPHCRILICGSLYLAGNVLLENG